MYHVRLVHELLSIGFTAKGVQGTPQLAPAEKTTLILGGWVRKNESSVFAPVCSGKNSYIKPCAPYFKKKKRNTIQSTRDNSFAAASLFGGRFALSFDAGAGVCVGNVLAEIFEG